MLFTYCYAERFIFFLFFRIELESHSHILNCLSVLICRTRERSATCPCAYLSIYLSICLSVYLSIYQDKRKIRNERFLNVPLCPSVCGAWWDACKDDLTCKEDWSQGFNWTTGA